MSMPQQQLVVRNLSVRLGDTDALREVSFSAQKGECLVLTGRSGSGKSTLLHALCRNIPATAGSIDAPSRIGLVSQDYSLFLHMRVGDQIAFGLHDRSRTERRSLVGKWLDVVGLNGYERRWPWELSGGEKQRVAIARALAPDPAIICMDEPLAALDFFARAKLQGWLGSLLETTGKTVVYVTHSLDEVIALGDRCLVLAKGRLVAEYPISIDRPRDPKRFDADLVTQLKSQILNSVFMENSDER